MLTSFIERLERRLLVLLQRRANTRQQHKKEERFTQKLKAFDAMGF
jgi:hypothetical protein